MCGLLLLNKRSLVGVVEVYFSGASGLLKTGRVHTVLKFTVMIVMASTADSVLSKTQIIGYNDRE